MNEFKLKQQLQACQKERDAWKARTEDYLAKLQKPAMIGQPSKLREEIAFWKTEARACSYLLDKERKGWKKEVHDLTLQRDLHYSELADAKLKVKELVEKLNLANDHVASVGAKLSPAVLTVSAPYPPLLQECVPVKPKRKRKPKVSETKVSEPLVAEPLVAEPPTAKQEYSTKVPS
jgi:hypothetical protein